MHYSARGGLNIYELYDWHAIPSKTGAFNMDQTSRWLNGTWLIITDKEIGTLVQLKVWQGKKNFKKLDFSSYFKKQIY